MMGRAKASGEGKIDLAPGEGGDSVCLLVKLPCNFGETARDGG